MADPGEGGALELVRDERITVLPLEALRRDLRCPVCLEIVHEATATECLHRFCTGCIETSLRLSKKECPTCRQPIATRRSLRRDPAFDALVRLFFPEGDRAGEDEGFFWTAGGEVRFAAAHAAAAGSDEWTCALCTYFNVRGARRCGICGQARGKQRKAAAAAGGPVGAPAAEGAGPLPPAGAASGGAAGPPPAQPTPAGGGCCLVPLEEVELLLSASASAAASSASSSASADKGAQEPSGARALGTAQGESDGPREPRTAAALAAARVGGKRRRRRSASRWTFLAHVRPIPRGALAPSEAAELERQRSAMQAAAPPRLAPAAPSPPSDAAELGGAGGCAREKPAEGGAANGRASPPLMLLLGKRSQAAVADAIRFGRLKLHAGGGRGRGGGAGGSDAERKASGAGGGARGRGRGRGGGGAALQPDSLDAPLAPAAAPATGGCDEAPAAAQPARSRLVPSPSPRGDGADSSSPFSSSGDDDSGDEEETPPLRPHERLSDGSHPRAVDMGGGAQGSAVFASVEIRSIAQGSVHVTWIYPPGNPGDCNAWVALVPAHRPADAASRVRHKLLTRNRMCGEVRFAPHELSKVPDGVYRCALHAPPLGGFPALSAAFRIAGGAPVGPAGASAGARAAAQPSAAGHELEGRDAVSASALRAEGSMSGGDDLPRGGERGPPLGAAQEPAPAEGAPRGGAAARSPSSAAAAEAALDGAADACAALAVKREERAAPAVAREERAPRAVERQACAPPAVKREDCAPPFFKREGRAPLPEAHTNGDGGGHGGSASGSALRLLGALLPGEKLGAACASVLRALASRVQPLTVAELAATLGEGRAPPQAPAELVAASGALQPAGVLLALRLLELSGHVTRAGALGCRYACKPAARAQCEGAPARPASQRADSCERSAPQPCRNGANGAGPYCAQRPPAGSKAAVPPIRRPYSPSSAALAVTTNAAV